MRHLSFQIYASFVAGILLFCMLIAILWTIDPRNRPERPFGGAVELLIREVPPPDRPLDELRDAVRRLGSTLGAEMTVRSADGTLLAFAGRPIPAFPAERLRPGWTHTMREGAIALVPLSGGRWLMIRDSHHPLRAFIVSLTVGVAIAIASYPVVRRLTKRLERLRARVEKLGAGDLTARVEVEGSDEVAALASSFNRAADRIEGLVKAQRTVLANASHELRSPLTRLRMAAELLPEAERPDLRDRIKSEIEELDELIGEILVASRLEATVGIDQVEDVDLLAMAAEEAAGAGAEVDGEAVAIRGDPRLLRRLLRNLLDNARRYGGGTPITVSVRGEGNGGARLSVSDSGPGIPEEERERIFEPFYRLARNRAETAGAGTGLGLSLVRQIARRHGGDACCRARSGGGTEFVVTLRSARA